MFRPFRKRRPEPDPPADHVDFDRAWADYVEWSGLDEAGLPDAQPDRDQQ